jgi:electron transfer flavoprotein alpha subunit
VTGWRIIAIAPAREMPDCSWRDAASAAQVIAAQHETRFDLILIGQAEGVDVPPWSNIQRFVVAECNGLKDDASHYGAVAAAALADVQAPACIILPAGAFGDEVAVALAARVNAHLLGQVNDIALHEGALEATRPAFGGRVGLTLAFSAGICIATMRRAPPAASGESVAAEFITVTVDLPPELPSEKVALPDRKPSLEGARLVVCGGRGLDAASFEKLDDIADALGGVVGGSLPAVDAGLAPVSHQVGQSGKFVTPKLYLGVGVSGTLQHLAGIDAATPILAINSDSDAAIFRYAELGVVADAREFLPMLITELNA